MRAPDFWQSNRLSAKACALALSPLGHLYGLSIRARRTFARPYRAQARVLCIGNLTAGGSGKTPVAIALAYMLAGRGERIAFLTRGYGGRLAGPVQVDPAYHSAAEVGDEALLLAAAYPTIVAHNREAGVKLADTLGFDIVVMDDGFQNFQLIKDLSFVVVDAETGFGNGRLIPAGPLRETPASGLRRADAVVLMGSGHVDLPDFARPVLRASLVPAAPEALTGQPMFAFAGIGRPEKFFETLRRSGAHVMGTMGFDDHHRYTALEISALRSAAVKRGARLVTTDKDFVRLEPAQRDAITPVPVRARFNDDMALSLLLDRLCEARA